MNFISKEHLLSGRQSNKTQEKIRIKLRILLNKYRKTCIFHSNYTDAKLAFHLENHGFKKAYIIYKTASIKSCLHYSQLFNKLYLNEVECSNEMDLMDNKTGDSGNYRLIIAIRKLKKGY